MAATEDKASAAEPDAGGAPGKRGRTKLILLIAVPVLLLGAGAGLWFSGILPTMFGMGAEQSAATSAERPTPPPQPGFVDLPEIVSNLNAPGRRPSFVRLRARIEIADMQDAALVNAAMPRLVDLFSTYLREVRPEELRGSAGSHRLREELIARAGVAVAAEVRGNRPPIRVTDVLFVEILIQ